MPKNSHKFNLSYNYILTYDNLSLYNVKVANKEELMPKETFKNLPKEKQNKLLTAAINEFSRVLYEEASINKIIESAQISRGSFYMYFNDKDDIYNYILCTDRKKIEERISQLLIQYNGDFILAWEKIYDEILEYCSDEKRYNFFRNFFIGMRFSSIREKFKPIEEEKTFYKQKILNKINKNLYDLKDDEQIFDAFMFLKMTTLSCITFKFLNPKLGEELYRNRIHILKYGLYERKIK